MSVAKASMDLEVSSIEPVDVVDLVKAKEDKLSELYGRSRLRLKDDMEFFPEDYRYPATDYERMAHIMTIELIAEEKRGQKSDALLEVIKTACCYYARKSVLAYVVCFALLGCQSFNYRTLHEGKGNPVLFWRTRRFFAQPSGRMYSHCRSYRSMCQTNASVR